VPGNLQDHDRFQQVLLVRMRYNEDVKEGGMPRKKPSAED